MKHNLLYAGVVALAVSLLPSCNKDGISRDTAVIDKSAKVFYAFTPSKDKEDTRTFLDWNTEMYWNKADRISVFRSSANECYEFAGETGEIRNAFNKVIDGSGPSQPMYYKNYAVYPYSSTNASGAEGRISVTLPAVQHYAEDSFGLGDNTMAAATEDAEDDVFHFRNACGYIQFKLYGGTVKQIRFRGNDGEKIAGAAILTVDTDETPVVEMQEGATDEITLDCTEDGIATGEDKDHARTFWLVVPPTTFTKGFTVEVTDLGGMTTTRKLSSSLTIDANYVQPISAFKIKSSDDCEMLSFSLTDGDDTYEAFEIKDNVVSIQVPNDMSLESLTATFKHTGYKVTVNGEEKKSGEGTMDYSNSAEPVKFKVESFSGMSNEYEIRIFNLPVVIIETPGHTPITSKEVWTENCSFKIRTADGKMKDLGATSVKGRGNSSWNQDKKPYAVKLGSKPKDDILGMPAHKRWCLLSNCWGYFFGNLIGYEMGRRSQSLVWSPNAIYVELILNGKHQGCYLLAEQIKIDKNRVNITQMSSTDTDEESITGGYLLTYDNTFDEAANVKFHSKYFNMPVMSKDPDEDVIVPQQLAYIKNYIDTLEGSLKDPVRFSTREYINYIDIDTFIDYYFVWEMAGESESGNSTDFNKPRSVYYYKDRNSVMKAGPVWDFDSFFFVRKKILCNSSMYYGKLFTDPFFVNRVKEKWPLFRSNIENGIGGTDLVSFLDSLYLTVVFSARRDRVIWPWASSPVTKSTVDEQYSILREGIPAKFDWLENYINSLTVTYDTKPGTTEDFAAQQDRSSDFSFTK